MVNNIQQSKATNIIVVWEHLKIPLIIQKLIDVEPNYVKISRKIFANLGDKFKVKSKQRVDPQSVTGIKYCAPEFFKENEQVRHYYIGAKANIKCSLAWEIDLDRKSFKVYPTYIIKRVKKIKKGQEYNVIKYL